MRQSNCAKRRLAAITRATACLVLPTRTTTLTIPSKMVVVEFYRAFLCLHQHRLEEIKTIIGRLGYTDYTCDNSSTVTMYLNLGVDSTPRFILLMEHTTTATLASKVSCARCA